mmetsp:Transcript_10910/g.27635  ORF Transcript_10910/g.27635 Transcript_10910/m.27635 type:complete len:200 (+) Transcript_10910:270-869(+)
MGIVVLWIDNVFPIYGKFHLGHHHRNIVVLSAEVSLAIVGRRPGKGAEIVLVFSQKVGLTGDAISNCRIRDQLGLVKIALVPGIKGFLGWKVLEGIRPLVSGNAVVIFLWIDIIDDSVADYHHNILVLQRMEVGPIRNIGFVNLVTVLSPQLVGEVEPLLSGNRRVDNLEVGDVFGLYASVDGISRVTDIESLQCGGVF